MSHSLISTNLDTGSVLDKCFICGQSWEYPAESGFPDIVHPFIMFHSTCAAKHESNCYTTATESAHYWQIFSETVGRCVFCTVWIGTDVQ